MVYRKRACDLGRRITKVLLYAPLYGTVALLLVAHMVTRRRVGGEWDA